jgi:hypothetical protein
MTELIKCLWILLNALKLNQRLPRSFLSRWYFSCQTCDFSNFCLTYLDWHFGWWITITVSFNVIQQRLLQASFQCTISEQEKKRRPIARRAVIWQNEGLAVIHTTLIRFWTNRNKIQSNLFAGIIELLVHDTSAKFSSWVNKMRTSNTISCKPAKNLAENETLRRSRMVCLRWHNVHSVFYDNRTVSLRVY